MANSAQARKRARQAEATRKRNASLKSELRSAVKKVKKAISSGDKASAAKTLQASQAAIDRIADKKVVHKNLASRTKSRLAQAIKAMASSGATSAPAVSSACLRTKAAPRTWGGVSSAIIASRDSAETTRASKMASSSVAVSAAVAITARCETQPG